MGEAALLFVSEVALAAGRRFPAGAGPQPSRLLIRGEPLGSPREAPALGVSLSWLCCISKDKGRASFLRLLTRWEEHSSELCFHTGALAMPQMLFIKQAALDVTAGYSVTDAYWGGSFLFEMPDSNC